MSKSVKIFFPVGIFLILALLFFSMSVSVAGYLYYKEITGCIEKSTKEANDASIALIDACSIIAELSDGRDQQKRLNDFFSGNAQKKLFTIAFYALADGTVIAHSDTEEIKRLNGNIAFDEFKYNIDQIFYPLSQNERKVYLADYYLTEEEIPFTKEEIFYIKKYLYDKIDRNGWLASKAVEKKFKTRKNRKIIYETRKTGTINFIVSKKPLYLELLQIKEKALKTGIMLAAASTIFSLFVSLIIYIRFLSIRRKSVRMPSSTGTARDSDYREMENYPENSGLYDGDDIDVITQDETFPEIFDESTGEKLDFAPEKIIRSSAYSEISMNGSDSLYRSEKRKTPVQIVFDESTAPVNEDIVILDAVPIKKRRIS